MSSFIFCNSFIRERCKNQDRKLPDRTRAGHGRTSPSSLSTQFIPEGQQLAGKLGMVWAIFFSLQPP
jgi:hypothetical protein